MITNFDVFTDPMLLPHGNRAFNQRGVFNERKMNMGISLITNYVEHLKDVPKLLVLIS